MGSSLGLGRLCPFFVCISRDSRCSVKSTIRCFLTAPNDLCNLGIERRFVFFVLSFFAYVLTGALKKQSGEIRMTLNSLVGLALSGFAGGVLLGWISVGIDITIFLILSALYKVDSRKATVTSILVIGWTSVFPLLYHIIDKKVGLTLLLPKPH